ncbi:hypothetical protein HPB47_001913 [Ixodes persulcatus]|uniref:Uncharacterized protein n=1 Tax=Ixodes persulcatus TaxID=34615 RepID=A0AC60PMQ3_IXOPE|nr:hypothetical protein HPB47_001913 [Ixodes persulcatus]
MTTYAASKVVIMREQICNDSRGSGLLFEVRTGALKMRAWRSQFYTTSTTICVICREAEEIIEHQVLQCEALSLCPRVDRLPVALGVWTTDGEEVNRGTSRDNQAKAAAVVGAFLAELGESEADGPGRTGPRQTCRPQLGSPPGDQGDEENPGYSWLGT